MGKRREPRSSKAIPVRIYGTDASGRMFSENVVTVDVSRTGAKLMGVVAEIKPGEIVGISHGSNKSRFNVKWVGQPGTPRAGQIGLMNLSPEKPVWDLPLPSGGIDSFRTLSASDRRQHARMQCLNSVQLQPDGTSAPIWGKASDLSMGGCFIEMPVPLAIGTKLRVALWLKQAKLSLKGKIVNSRPGFGNGIQFTEVSPSDAELLRGFLQSISQMPIR